MTYSILLLKDNKNDNIEKAKQLLEEVGQKFSRSFAFDTCDLSASNDEIIKKAKSAHAVLLGEYTPALRGICKELGLYASVRRVGDCLLVHDAFGGIYDGEKGFRNNPTFGREAYDVESYSELEIERVARIAYELSPSRHITLIDKADELATSKLWRKIVTDINEDYPFVNVDMVSIESALGALIENPAHDTLLTTHLFGDIIYSALSAKPTTLISTSEASQQSKSNEVAALLGDTTLGMYIIPNSPLRANQQSNRNEVAAFMLRHSFDMHTEADYIESL